MMSFSGLVITLVVVMTLDTSLAADQCNQENSKLSVVYNPDCPMPIDCAYINVPMGSSRRQNLVYVQSQKCNHVTHGMLSTIGVPSVLFASTDNQTKLLVRNWTHLTEHRPLSITLDPAQTSTQHAHVHGFRINQLYRFADPHDKADISEASDVQSIDLSTLNWLRAEMNETEEKIHVRICSNDETPNSRPDVFGNGTLCITMCVFSDDGRDPTLPRLRHSPRSVQFDVELNGLSLNSLGQKTRFALELMFMSSVHGEIRKDVDLSIDDEYTPGIFKTVDVSYPHYKAHATWKPVSYKQSEHARTAFTQTRSSDLQTPLANEDESGILYAYFNGNWTDIDKYGTNLTIGYPKDGYYTSTMYASWSVSLGLGDPEAESISALLLFLLIVCVCIPVLALLCALLCGCVFWCSRRRAARLDADREYLVDGDTFDDTNTAGEHT